MELHAKEAENLEKKQAIIAKIREIDYTNFKSNKQWGKAVEKIQALQAEWRTIGFAPKKQNQAIYDEYRAVCEEFFKAKTTFYKEMRDMFAENLAKKRALIEKAEALKDSDAWAETSAALVELQKEWKTIGPVARKYSDEIWKKFTATCDEFFNKKREMVKETRNERHRARGERVMASGDRDKLVRMYQNLQQEIKTAENNILFFTGKSKSGNKLVEDMQKKIDGLKKQLQELEDKINEIDAAE